MRADALPSLERCVSGGADLRYDAADAISYVQLAAPKGSGGVASAKKLRDFFIACANACDTAAGGDGIVTDGVLP
jgi:hypothetical protein